MENRRDALHGLLAVGRAAESGKTEVSLASRTKANARRTYYLGLLKQKVEEVPRAHLVRALEPDVGRVLAPGVADTELVETTAIVRALER